MQANGTARLKRPSGRLKFFASPARRAKIGASVPFVWQARVYYEDTDFSGLVYHASHLKFFERARTEWLRTAGCGHETLLREHRAVFAVSRIEVDYLKGARIDDLLDITVVPLEIRRVVFLLEQEARCADLPIARALVKVACLDADTLAPRAIPAFLLQSLNA